MREGCGNEQLDTASDAGTSGLAVWCVEQKKGGGKVDEGRDEKRECLVQVI